jgi:glucose/mannose-6-phosphate isomerase
MTPNSENLLDNPQKIKIQDKNSMLAFCTNISENYKKAYKNAEKISLNFPKPDNIIVAGMGGSAIGGDLLKDWAKNKIQVPIEVNRDYQLPAYADKKTLVLITSYSGDTEESLSAFLDALNRGCMVYCISSGGALLEYAEKLNVPYLQVEKGMPPRAALPYMLMPLLVCMEKMGLTSGLEAEVSEAVLVLKRCADACSPEVASKNNLAKTLAIGINGSVPSIYGFGVYRSVAQRFKQQFNENSKIAAKWEVFPELDHNEIVGWEKSQDTAKHFSIIFINDPKSPKAILSRIKITKQLIKDSGVKMFDVESLGKTDLAKMLSVICLGDFISVYLAVLRKVDPTPVQTINHLKAALGENKVKDKIVASLTKLAEKA